MPVIRFSRSSTRGTRRHPAHGAKLVVPPGYVGLECANPPLRLVAVLGEDPPVVSDGLGGWEATDRPQQTAMTTWKGNAPYTLALSFVLDGYLESEGGGAGNSVEGRVASLWDVARGRESEPGSVSVRGIPGLPADDWVIGSIEEQEPLIRRPTDNKRVRQGIALTLMEYVPPEWESIKKTALKGAKARTHIVTVKRSPSKHDSKTRGETPAQLAKRLHVEWTDLRALNPKKVKGANTALRAGDKLRAPLPRPAHRKHGGKGDVKGKGHKG